MPHTVFLVLILSWIAVLKGEAAQTIALFNRTNLNGWVSYLVDTKHEDPRKVFSVTNNLLRISGDGLGYLATEAVFTNYHLTVDYCWGSTNTQWGGRIGKARDSGIFMHAVGPHGNSHDGNGAFMAAIECNIFQGAVGDFLLIRGNDEKGKLIAPRVTTTVLPHKDRDGWFTADHLNHRPSVTLERMGRINWYYKDPEWRDEFDFRGKNDFEKEPGNWNTIECIVRDGTIVIYLNGRKVNHARKVWPDSGRILLQCEGSEIFFRRVELVPLKSLQGASFKEERTEN